MAVVNQTQENPFFIGQNGFLYWVGVVEDNADPFGSGRVRVRIHGHHSDDQTILPTHLLPWAVPVMPVTSAGVGGIGASPTGMLPGTRVLGFFLDGKARQVPMVIGTLIGQHVSAQVGMTPGGMMYQPSLLPGGLSGPSSSGICYEGDCPSGDATGASYVDSGGQDQSQTFPLRNTISASEWVCPTTGFVSSEYGPRGSSHHRGVDICPAGFYPQTDPGRPGLGGVIKGPVGIPVVAAADGKVVFIWTANRGQGGVATNYDATGTGSRSFGNAIAIRHELSTGTYTTIYAHLGRSQDAADDPPGAGIEVELDQIVSKGQLIGYMGRSHCYTSPTHLHFETRTGTALPRSNNHFNPGEIFPQMRNRHASFRAFVDSGVRYDTPPPYSPEDAPIRQGDGPAS